MAMEMMKRKVGRPVKGTEALTAWRSLMIDRDIQDLLVETANKLEVELGFRPKRIQALRYLLGIGKGKENGPG